MKPFIERTLGRVLRSVRAGNRCLAWNDARLVEAPDVIHLGSPSFADGEPMPERHAGVGVGENISPALTWTNVPEDAVELVLVLQDPDAPLSRPVVHVIATGLLPASTGVAEGALMPGHAHAGQFSFGTGSFGRIGYAGPRPVRGHGTHRYIFQIFAISKPLALGAAPTLEMVLAGMNGSVVGRGRITGTFRRD